MFSVIKAGVLLITWPILNLSGFLAHSVVNSFNMYVMLISCIMCMNVSEKTLTHLLNIF